jgi:hypothetical protein
MVLPQVDQRLVGTNRPHRTLFLETLERHVLLAEFATAVTDGMSCKRLPH